MNHLEAKSKDLTLSKTAESISTIDGHCPRVVDLNLEAKLEASNDKIMQKLFESNEAVIAEHGYSSSETIDESDIELESEWSEDEYNDLNLIFDGRLKDMQLSINMSSNENPNSLTESLFKCFGIFQKIFFWW